MLRRLQPHQHGAPGEPATEGFHEHELATLQTTVANGDTVNVDTDLAVGAEARVEFRGTKWTVKNVGSAAITSGTRARVVRADGLTLHVEAD